DEPRLGGLLRLCPGSVVVGEGHTEARARESRHAERQDREQHQQHEHHRRATFAALHGPSSHLVHSLASAEARFRSVTRLERIVVQGVVAFAAWTCTVTSTVATFAGVVTAAGLPDIAAARPSLCTY